MRHAAALLAENSIGSPNKRVAIRAKQADDLGAVAIGMHYRGKRLAIE